MARTTTGGHVPVGGRRRPCSRLLPVILVLAGVALVPWPVAGSSSADAWLSAQMVHRTHSSTIGEATRDLADGGSEREVRELRILVATAVRDIDRLEVHACFQVWWSYVRSSYVLFDQALAGLESNDLARVQSASSASRYLSALAASVEVECPRGEAPAAGRVQPGSRERLPLADDIEVVAAA